MEDRMKSPTFAGTKVINGIDVYYEHYGADSQETLVLLHGFLSSTFSYRQLIPLLSQHYNVISVDLPPFGKSGKTTRFIYSYKNLASTVVELVKSLGYEQASLVGHSMGGQISLNILHYFPEFAKKSVLLCSSGYLKRAKRHLILSSYIPYFYLYVKLYLARSGLKNNLQKVVHDQSLIDEEMLFGYLSPFLEDDIFKALTQMIRHREGDLSKEELRKIETPCLLIWGEHDKVVPLNVGKRLKQDLKESQLVVLPDAGHLIPEEKPEQVLHHINIFLRN